MICSQDILERLSCRCCGKANLDPRMVKNVRHIFGMLGHELTITSGYRCEKHNTEVGGASGSYHVKGMAVDLLVSDADEREEIAELAWRIGFGGVGWGNGFMHLDFGPVREWRYGADGKPIHQKIKGA